MITAVWAEIYCVNSPIKVKEMRIIVKNSILNLNIVVYIVWNTEANMSKEERATRC
jgi:hypothetical protein